MKKLLWWVLVPACLASCGPGDRKGPLTGEEAGLVGEYYRAPRGSVPGSGEDISRRLQTKGADPQAAVQAVDELRKSIHLPQETLSLNGDRTFELGFGRGRSSGSWWLSSGLLVLHFPRQPEEKNPLDHGRVFRLRVTESGGLADLEGGEPFLRKPKDEAPEPRGKEASP